jgi:hypothetical protein
VPETLVRAIDSRYYLVDGDTQANFDLRDEAPSSSEVLRVMRLISKRVRGLERLSQILDLSINEVEDFMAIGRQFAMLDSENRLTDIGRAELRRAERSGILDGRVVPIPGAFYFPTQLRNVRGSSS